MPLDPNLQRRLVAELTADLCREHLDRQRGLGLFVHDLPPLDVPTFLRRLAEGTTTPTRVAVLGGTRNSFSVPSPLRLTVDPTEANRWRNDAEARAGTPCVVLKVGSAPKLNSLVSALPNISSPDLRAAVVRRAELLNDIPERRYFWKAVERATDAFPIDALLAMLAELVERSDGSRNKVLEHEPRLVHHLGLLRQDALLTSRGPGAAAQSIRRNRELVDRLRRLGDTERRNVVAAAEDEADPERRATALAILRYERSGEHDVLSSLSHAAVLRVLRPAVPPAPPGPDGEQQPQDPQNRGVRQGT